MAAQRSSFEKLQRDRAKQAKQAAKRAKRQERSEGPGPEAEVSDAKVSDYGEELSAADLLELVEALHKQFEAKQISFEEFEDQKTELFSRLPVD